ncbi:hypothetical protein T08_3645 [Trichinella sp. T8]|nr:hypothetical protein T08_3645 [Trichinella sp. T8]
MFHVQKLVVSGSVERDLLMGDFSMQYRKLIANLSHIYRLVLDDTLKSPNLENKFFADFRKNNQVYSP